MLAIVITTLVLLTVRSAYIDQYEANSIAFESGEEEGSYFGLKGNSSVA